jgi:ATP adenylyltransferase
MAYIQAAPRRKERGCLFCRVPASRDDAGTLLLHRGRACFTMLNRYPYNGGHLMVAPYAHRAKLQSLSGEEMRELLEEAREMEALLDRVLRPHGYNLGVNLGRIAGQGVVGHIHLHLVPRWDGDTNFMPVCADTRVISEALDELYRRLRAALPRGGTPSRRSRRAGPGR